MRKLILYSLMLLAMVLTNCSNQSSQSGKFIGAPGEVKLITLAPGHFHAYLVQKSMYPQIDSTVFVYAPEGQEVENHLAMIQTYNTRPENPTAWKQHVYTGADYLERMVADKQGNVVVLAGNNSRKTNYIHTAVQAGMHVLSDKPMAINKENFALLRDAFSVAEKNDVLLYDIMTERFEITSLLQKELMHMPDIFGDLQQGSLEDPAVIKESVHHLFKYVSGNVLRRPPWYFDVNQQGEGIVDVTTHLVDLVQWACFPEQIIDYNTDIEMLAASRWPTMVSLSQFKQITRSENFPSYLNSQLTNDTLLALYANGEMNYTLKGIHARIIVKWDFQAPEGTGDTHYSLARGSKAHLIIRQGAAEGFQPVLYIEPVVGQTPDNYISAVENAFDQLEEKYPGLQLETTDKGWKVNVPEIYKVGHEAHFAQVTEKFLQYLIDGKLPDWEVPNMIAKYYTMTSALEAARNTR